MQHCHTQCHNNCVNLCALHDVLQKQSVGKSQLGKVTHDALQNKRLGNDSTVKAEVAIFGDLTKAPGDIHGQFQRMCTSLRFSGLYCYISRSHLLTQYSQSQCLSSELERLPTQSKTDGCSGQPQPC